MRCSRWAELSAGRRACGPRRALIGAQASLDLNPGTIPGYEDQRARTLALLGLGFAALGTMRESLVAIYVNPEDRSRIMALLQTTVMLVSVPFGYIGGLLSDINRALPFALNIGLLSLGILATTFFFKDKRPARP